MISFASILKPSSIAVDIEVSDKDAALVAATDLLAGSIDARSLLTEVRAREALSSTGIGEGIAVPHAISASIPKSEMAVLRLARPIDYASIDGAPVDLLFLLVGPHDDSQAHLQILSKLARLLYDPTFRQAIRAAPDATALARLFHEKD